MYKHNVAKSLLKAFTRTRIVRGGIVKDYDLMYTICNSFVQSKPVVDYSEESIVFLFWDASMLHYKNGELMIV